MNKKLLILGANYVEIELVNAAKSNGIYTIVTDNRPNKKDSPAKAVADEAWDISWSDIDSLEIICKEKHIDGVIAGYSEFRVDSMIQLCKRLELPCSITAEQLEITRDKIKFKRLCEQYDLPTIPEYNYPNVNNYPVIIKPVDRAGSVGINVAYNRQQLELYYYEALSLSPSKRVIIEDFIHDGVKFDIYYYVQNGNSYFLGSSDTVLCNGKEGKGILQKAWTFPSIHEKQFLEEYDAKIKYMLHGLGMHDCYVTMSAFYRNGGFYFFEAGFRLSGEKSHHYYQSVSGINYMTTMINYSLGLQKDSEQMKDAFEFPPIYSVILNYFGKEGVVAQVDCLTMNDCTSLDDISWYITKGEKNAIRNGLYPKILMLTLSNTDKDSLKKTLNICNSKVNIIDSSGEDMVYEYLNDNNLDNTILK